MARAYSRAPIPDCMYRELNALRRSALRVSVRCRRDRIDGSSESRVSGNRVVRTTPGETETPHLRLSAGGAKRTRGIHACISRPILAVPLDQQRTLSDPVRSVRDRRCHPCSRDATTGGPARMSCFRHTRAPRARGAKPRLGGIGGTGDHGTPGPRARTAPQHPGERRARVLHCRGDKVGHGPADGRRKSPCEREIGQRARRCAESRTDVAASTRLAGAP